MAIRQWKLPRYCADLPARLAAETGRPELVCRILAARGYTSGDEVEALLSEDAGLDDPFLLADMDRAAARIRAALDNGERICVYGDYDCDGITATSLLTGYLQAEGADVIYYLPQREKEGYGLNISAVDMLKSRGVRLIVTVDNGISAHGEIAHAAGLGIDVVVSDHHTPRETLPPDAVAVVNPHRADCSSRYKDLAGVGVAFKLVCALEGGAESAPELLEYYAELVALGTVADVVPLTGENRVFVRHGLRAITSTGSPGIAALIDAGGLRGRTLNSESLAYGIIPRINAAGRIGVADEVVELLLTDDADYAAEIATRLNDQNTKRKNIEEEIMGEIEAAIAADPQITFRRILIVSGQCWHHGVVGIVASRLMERYQKPCIVFSVDHGEARGSGRSVPDFSLIEAITACSEYLTRFGGHSQAAGLTVPQEHLDDFRARIEEYARERYPVMPVPLLYADCTLRHDELTVEAVSFLDCLEPFGAGNESPLFHMEGLVISGVYPTNDGRHIRIRFSGSGGGFYAVYFGMPQAAFPYQPGDTVEIMAKITTQEYNGKMRLSVKISDLRPSGVPQEQVLLGRERYAFWLRGEPLEPTVMDEMFPAREDIALAYRYLRGVGTYSYGTDALYLRLMRSGADYCRLLLTLDVLEEMGFVRRTDEEGRTVYTVIPEAPKADLTDSTILQRLTTLKTETLVNNF